MRLVNPVYVYVFELIEADNVDIASQTGEPGRHQYDETMAHRRQIGGSDSGYRQNTYNAETGANDRVGAREFPKGV